MANAEHPMSYTEAMARIAHAAKIDSLLRISSLELSPENSDVVAEAIQHLVAGSDLVIFGLAGSGRSTAAYSVLQTTQLRSHILTSHRLETALLRSYLVAYSSVQAQDRFNGNILIGAEVLMVDELHRSFADQGAQLSTTVPRILVVQGKNLDDARWNLERTVPELVLRSPVFLEATYDRVLKLYELRIHRAA